MRTRGLAIVFLAGGIVTAVVAQETPRPDFSKVPGVVIDHSPASSGLYIGSPSLASLPDGGYLASHDLFGPRSAEHESPMTLVFRSSDRGASWQPAARLKGLFWANLFTHRGAAYLMGADKHHGRIVIRRSTDNGRTWTEPRDGQTGLLTRAGQYHTAPVPVVLHAGRLWRGFEDASGGKKWGERYRAGMLSVPEDADLLKATNWTFSNFLPGDPKWLSGGFRGWLEGNAVLTRDGRMLDILRVDTPGSPEKGAVVTISPDGKTARFDPAGGFIDFPGGAKKFTIRHDPASGLYWSLVNYIPPQWVGPAPAGTRNTLALVNSPDLREWTVRCVLLHHPDRVRHAFQYVDWLFEGENIIAVSRTAYDDGLGGAVRAHDANLMTFHRFTDFRNLTPEDSVEGLRSAQSLPHP